VLRTLEAQTLLLKTSLYTQKRVDGKITGDPFWPKIDGNTTGYDISPETMLVNKVAENPIPHGGQRSGWLCFRFANLRADELRKATFTLTYKDVLDVEYKTVPDKSHAYRAAPNSMYFPGMKMPKP
jgi:hypothetical protein